ncbi:MAG: glycosyltransferase family 2 protein [Planctomycetia bacterium]
MRRSVSVVVPALDDRELLERNLPPLLALLAARGAGDEVVVVDDTGTGALAAWIAERFPPPESFDAACVEVRCVAREQNGGFQLAARSGVDAAAHELVLLLNPDVRVEDGFLEPLVDALSDPGTVAATGRLLLAGDPSHVESLLRPCWRDGALRMREHGTLPDDDAASESRAWFPLGGFFLARKADLKRQRFDPLYAPFYLEDVDLGFEWRAQGRAIAYRHDSRASHDHRGSVGSSAAECVDAAIERNALLFAWKHADPELLEEHLDALEERAARAWAAGDKEALVVVAAALEELSAATRSRARRGAGRSFRDLLSEP